MNTFAIVAVFSCVIFAYSSAYEMVEDIDGQQYYLVPAETVGHRQRRQADKGNIFDNGIHRVDGGLHGSGTRPTNIGGNLGYTHIPSGNGLKVGVDHARGWGQNLGTNVRAAGTANVWRSDSGNTRLDAVGSWQRSYGGVMGTGKPNWYGGLQFQHRF